MGDAYRSWGVGVGALAVLGMLGMVVGLGSGLMSALLAGLLIFATPAVVLLGLPLLSKGVETVKAWRERKTNKPKNIVPFFESDDDA
jgi:hypothetical protein